MVYGLIKIIIKGERKMKKTRKVLSTFLMLMLIVGLFIPTVVSADPPTKLDGTFEAGDTVDTKPAATSVVVHKLQADKYTIANPIGHNAGKLSDTQLGQIGTNVKELDGVTFTIYKLKDEAQLKTFMDTPSSYDTTTKVEGLSNYSTDITKITPTIQTAGGTGATVSLGEGYYWFVESAKPTTVSSSLAVPFGLSLPLTNADGTKYLGKIHVYPKNTTGAEPEIDKFVTEIENKTNSYQIGETVPYVITVSIPANIHDYTKFEITDQLDTKLSYIGGNTKVVYGDYSNVAAIKSAPSSSLLNVDTDYTLTEPTGSAHKLTINLKDTKLKTLYSGTGTSKLYIYFEAKINDTAVVDTGIDNGASVTFKTPKQDEKTNSVSELKKPVVVTGGKQFKKVDSIVDTKVLGNAEFQLFDGTNEVKWNEDLIKANLLALNAGKFSLDGKGTAVLSDLGSKTAEDFKAVLIPGGVAKSIFLKSASDGTFEIKGLPYSSYQKKKMNSDMTALVDNGAPVTHSWKLKETKAPEGYALQSEAITFTISTGSYASAAGDGIIKNKSLTIPQTGGIGTILFTVVGLSVMGIALFAMKRKKDEEQEEI